MKVSYLDASPNAAQFAALFESTGWNREYQLDEQTLFDAIRKSWYLVSAYDGERLVGFGRIISDGVLHALIVDLMVLPTCQGQGIGSAILSRLVERCQASGIRDIQLFCAKGKTGFYERHGFAARPFDAPGMQFIRY